MIWLWLSSAPQPFEGHELILTIIILIALVGAIWTLVSITNELRRK